MGCWTDSKIAWYWIIQSAKEWKQFLQHSVDEIRKLVPADCWKHCPGSDNLADLPSSGMDCRELKANTLGWNGPKWLTISEGPDTASELNEELFPEEFLREMKASTRKVALTGELSALTMNSELTWLSNVIHFEASSSHERLLQVTALVMNFVKLLKARYRGDKGEELELTSADVEEAELSWIKDVQKSLKCKKEFGSWKQQWN